MPSTGAGIRVYWVIDEPSMPHQVFTDPQTLIDFGASHRNSALRDAGLVHVMFVDEQTFDAALRGLTTDSQGLNTFSVFFLHRIWDQAVVGAGFNHLMTTAAAVCHETTHLLLHERNTNGFDDGEHTTNPDEDAFDNLIDPNTDPDDYRDLMYFQQTAANNNQIVWLMSSIRRINLRSKEGVER